MRPQKILLDARRHRARPVLRQVRQRSGGVNECAGYYAGGNEGNWLAARATGTIRSATRCDILLHDQERRHNRAGVDLVDVVTAQQPYSTFAYVTDLRNGVERQLTLNGEAPFVNRWHPEVLIEQ